MDDAQVYLVWLIRALVEGRKISQGASGCQRVLWRFFTLSAIQGGAQMLPATLVGHNPRAAEKRRLMSDMLAVSAGQIGDPVPFFILMIADDGLIHVLIMLAAVRLTFSIHR